jgi:toxin ParE1/3/4
MADDFLTNKAVEDLSEIWNYTFDTWSESQADKYYMLIIGFCKKLSENPTMGKNYREVDKNIFGYRVGQHIIFYRVINSNRIEIVRILHSRMDIRTRL